MQMRKKGVIIKIILIWDIDYNESYKEEREVQNLKINGKDIQNFEKLYGRKRWLLVNYSI